MKPNIIKGIGVLNWFKKQEVPYDKKVTYLSYTVDEHPEKDETYCITITFCGEIIDYFCDITIHTTSIETMKLNWNSVLYTPGAKDCTGDISNMNLMLMIPEDGFINFLI